VDEVDHDQPDAAQQRRSALSRWDNEGGAGPDDRPPPLAEADADAAVPALTDAELVQLRVRMIALENLVIALLAEASDRQRELAREMATYISPRPGFTPHRLTLHAASQMIHLVERSTRFRGA
jgi:hypothetical protein